MDLFNHKIKSAVTLLELVVVIIILGVLVTLGLPGYIRLKERSLGQEAIGNLRLIASAERSYFVERNHYYPLNDTVSDIGLINDNLWLSLSETNWDYSISDSDSGGAIFTATADRTSGPYEDCIYIVDNSDPENPTPNASCP